MNRLGLLLGKFFGRCPARAVTTITSTRQRLRCERERGHPDNHGAKHLGMLVIWGTK